MSGNNFEYPFWATAFYKGLLIGGMPVSSLAVDYPLEVAAYYGILIFLGLFLRPLIEKFALDELYYAVTRAPFRRMMKREAARREVEFRHKQHNKRYRYMRYRSKELPPKW